MARKQTSRSAERIAGTPKLVSVASTRMAEAEKSADVHKAAQGTRAWIVAAACAAAVALVAVAAGALRTQILEQPNPPWRTTLVPAEACACCAAIGSATAKPPRDCLTNVAHAATMKSRPTNTSFQHVQFTTLARELQDESCNVVMATGAAWPAWLAGSMFKNGFGKYESAAAGYSFVSLFDVMAYAARIRIHPPPPSGEQSPPRITVTAKFTRSGWFNESEVHGENPPFRTFRGTDPPLSLWGKMQLMMTTLSDNLNVNIVRIGRKLVEISDMDGFNLLSDETMEYEGAFRFHDVESWSSAPVLAMLSLITTAHPSAVASRPNEFIQMTASPGGRLLPRWDADHVGPLLWLGVVLAGLAASLVVLARHATPAPNPKKFSATVASVATMSLIIAASTLGCVCLLFFTIDGGFGDDVAVNRLVLHRVNTSESPLRRHVLAELPSSRVSYVHEFAQTKRHVIVVEWPLFWDISSIISPVFNDPSTLKLRWDPSRGTRFTVVDAKSGAVVARHKTTTPFWAYHIINAHDLDDASSDVAIDACTFDSPEHLETFVLHTLRRAAFHVPPNINRRFVVSATHGVSVTRFGPIGFDLPTVPVGVRGEVYTFAYGTGHRQIGDWWNSLVKVNVRTGATVQWFEEHVWPSQPVMVQSPRATREDDGVVVALMSHGLRNQSFVLVLNATTMTEIARAWIPVALPYTSHGFFE